MCGPGHHSHESGRRAPAYGTRRAAAADYSDAEFGGATYRLVAHRGRTSGLPRDRSPNRRVARRGITVPRSSATLSRARSQRSLASSKATHGRKSGSLPPEPKPAPTDRIAGVEPSIYSARNCVRSSVIRTGRANPPRASHRAPAAACTVGIRPQTPAWVAKKHSVEAAAVAGAAGAEIRRARQGASSVDADRAQRHRPPARTAGRETVIAGTTARRLVDVPLGGGRRHVVLSKMTSTTPP